MKISLTSYTVLAASALLGFKAQSVEAVEGAVYCDCKNIANSFIVTRLWNIIDPEWTDKDVIDEFDSGFAPLVTHMEGFQEYNSASTSVENTVFFMNIFESKELAKAAQEGAKSFVQKGRLNGVITPNQFTENELHFHMAADTCITDTYAGKYMGTQIFSLTEAAALQRVATTETLVQAFEIGFAENVTGAEGFLEYGGSIVTGTDLMFFYVVFDNAEGVTKANAEAEAFVQGSELNGLVEKVVFTEGAVDFDYTCAAGNVPAPFEDAVEGANESSAASSSSVILASFLAIVSYVALM